MFRSVRGALALIGSKRRGRLLGVAALGLVVSLLEAASAVVVLVLMKLILEPEGALVLPLLGNVRGVVPAETHAQVVTWLAAAFSVFFVVRAGVFLFQRYALARVVENTGVALADELVRGYLEMPYEQHLRRNSAELVRNAYDNVQQAVGSVFTPVVELISEAVLVAVMLTVLLLASPVLTLLAGAVVGCTVLVTLQLVQPRLKRLGRERQSAARRALQDLQQGFTGVRDVKLHAAEGSFSRSFRRARTRMAQAQRGRVVLAYVPRVSIETVFLAVILGALVVAVRSGAVGATLSTLGVFAYAGMRIQPSVQKIANAMTSLRYASAAVEDLEHDLRRARVAGSRSDRVGEGPIRLSREIRLQQVSYAYPGADGGVGARVLHDVDLTIRKGERIGIVGTTGCGKSTLLDLVCGLLQPTSGAVLVDGVDIRRNPRAWQTSIGFVQQAPFLLDASIRENVALGVDPEAVDEGRLRQAIAAAQLEALVAELPDGLETTVGERGVRLSGGQRQRVTLARALYRRPPVLILDEGTAALDGATEEAVIAALRDLSSDTTLLMVAHRVSTLADCDRVVRLDSGRLLTEGPRDELFDAQNQARDAATGTQS